MQLGRARTHTQTHTHFSNYIRGKGSAKYKRRRRRRRLQQTKVQTYLNLNWTRKTCEREREVESARLRSRERARRVWMLCGCYSSAWVANCLCFSMEYPAIVYRLYSHGSRIVSLHCIMRECKPNLNYSEKNRKKTNDFAGRCAACQRYVCSKQFMQPQQTHTHTNTHREAAHKRKQLFLHALCSALLPA